MPLDIETGKYFMDIDVSSKNEKDITKGFREFFLRTALDDQNFKEAHGIKIT